MRIYLVTIVTLTLACVGCSNDRPEVGKAPDLGQARDIRDQLFSEATETGPDPAVADLEPEDYQTFSGVVKLSGDPPAANVLKIDKDLSVCLPGGGSMTDNVIHVSSDNSLKSVLIYVEILPDSWVHESAKTNDTEAVFDQKQCLFLEPIVAVQTSQKLLIKNSDPIGHNTKFQPRSNPALNVTLAGGDVYPYDPQQAEAQPFEVNCTVHAWMKSSMIFRDNGYFAVTDADGKFEIPNMPTGVPLQIKVWHPLGASMKSVTIDSEQVPLKRGSMEYTLTPGGANEITMTVDATQLK